MLSLLLAASLSFSRSDASLAYETVSRLVSRHTPRDAGTRRGRYAADFLLDVASAAGADVRLDEFSAPTPVGKRTFANLYAEFKSRSSDAWVVFLSHYDTKPGAKCPGANDGASTSGLLVALADVLSSWRERPVNVMLIWTDGEECMKSYLDDDGLWGARRAAEMLRRKDVKVHGVFCLDMLGDRDLGMCVPKNGTPELVSVVMGAARRAKVGVTFSPMLVKDDHVPFLNAGFKAVDIIDFDFGSAPGRNDYWHTEQDTMDKVSVDSLLSAGRLAAEIVNAFCYPSGECPKNALNDLQKY